MLLVAEEASGQAEQVKRKEGRHTGPSSPIFLTTTMYSVLALLWGSSVLPSLLSLLSGPLHNFTFFRGIAPRIKVLLPTTRRLTLSL